MSAHNLKLNLKKSVFILFGPNKTKNSLIILKLESFITPFMNVKTWAYGLIMNLGLQYISLTCDMQRVKTTVSYYEHIFPTLKLKMCELLNYIKVIILR